MTSPLVCVVYVYEQFIQHHYVILSVSLTVEKWQLGGAFTDATKSVCLRFAGKEGDDENSVLFPLSEPWELAIL